MIGPPTTASNLMVNEADVSVMVVFAGPVISSPIGWITMMVLSGTLKPTRCPGSKLSMKIVVSASKRLPSRAEQLMACAAPLSQSVSPRLHITRATIGRAIFARHQFTTAPVCFPAYCRLPRLSL